jgi:hypothetical protein
MIASILLSGENDANFPLEIQVYLERMLIEETPSSTIVSLYLGFPFFIGCIVAPIGLFFFKEWAAYLYVISNIGLLLTNIGFGPYIEHSWMQALLSLGGILTGLIIGMIFFTDAVFSRAEEINN